MSDPSAHEPPEVPDQDRPAAGEPADGPVGQYGEGYGDGRAPGGEGRETGARPEGANGGEGGHAEPDRATPPPWPSRFGAPPGPDQPGSARGSWAQPGPARSSPYGQHGDPQTGRGWSWPTSNPGGPSNRPTGQPLPGPPLSGQPGSGQRQPGNGWSPQPAPGWQRVGWDDRQPPGYGPPPTGFGPPPATRPDRRTPIGLLLVLALLLGLGGGLIGGFLAAGDNSTSPTSAPQPRSNPQPPVIQTGPVPGGGGANPVVRVAKAMLPSVVSLDVRGTTSEVTGSGFVYDTSGHVVTNNHVIEPAVNGGTITVSTSDGRTFTASIVGRSPSYDLAVIKLDNPSDLTPATLGSSASVQVGQSVVAFGSPLGLSSTVTSGIISATQRPVTVGGEGETSYMNALQTDAAINPGNSGGPLVDLAARVIGVNSAIATVSTSQQPGQESGNIGVGFAIPIDQVVRTVTQIIKTGRAAYPIIGAEVSVTQTTDGARVQAVTPGGPADQAGIRAGDVIKKIDDAKVADGVELIVKIRSFEPGQRVTLAYDRGGSEQTTAVVLGRKFG